VKDFRRHQNDDGFLGIQKCVLRCGKNFFRDDAVVFVAPLARDGEERATRIDDEEE
jgi:hypothetical protein